MSKPKTGLAQLAEVRRVLTNGGMVRFVWVSGHTVLISPTGKRLTTLDGRTYQGFSQNRRFLLGKAAGSSLAVTSGLIHPCQVREGSCDRASVQTERLEFCGLWLSPTHQSHGRELE